ncbi:MAG: EboA domain-containing protein [Tatlockia sp.]|jgi:hypothetical protein
MSASKQQVVQDKALDFFRRVLLKYEPKALTFIEAQKDLFTSPSNLAFYTSFSTLPQHIEHEKPVLSQSELEEAASMRKNLDLSHWFPSQIARVYLILLLAKHKPDAFQSIMDNLIGAADVVELIALYQAFPLFPNPEQFLLHGTNGIRCNMISVFNAIALNNPYPADYFNETAFNQVVLKTLFVDSPIERVSGLKQRANVALAQALLNTVRERFAAKRPIKPEIWFLIGLAADDKALKVLEEFLETDNPILQQGALLACKQSKRPLAMEMQKRHAEQYKQGDMPKNLKWAGQFESRLINQN